MKILTAIKTSTNIKEWDRVMLYFMNCGNESKQDKFRELCSQNKAFEMKKRLLFGFKIIATAECKALMQSN